MIVYRIALALLLPILALIAAVQLARGRMKLADVRERLALDLDELADGAVLWVHGASNGEITAARPMIETALARDPNLRIVLTVNSINARRLARDWALDRVTLRLAPLDLRPVLKRFLDRTQPDALLTIENELWPNRFDMCRTRSIAVFVAGARLSEKSASNWHRMKPLLKPLMTRTLDAVTRLAAQDVESEQRLLQLGLHEDHLLPRLNLKSGVALKRIDVIDPLLAVAFDKKATILAASTHAGEETAVIDAFVAVHATHPTAKLILAPRHPARGDEIEALLEASPLDHARRSKDEAPQGKPVYLADTLGEMALWYELAGITFVGGSLVDLGGHTPFEPAQFGTAILHGPHVSNHSAPYSALELAHAAVKVTDAQSLSVAFERLLDDPDHAVKLARKGAQALDGLRRQEGALAAFWSALASVPNLRHLSPASGEHRLQRP